MKRIFLGIIKKCHLLSSYVKINHQHWTPNFLFDAEGFNDKTIVFV